MPRFGKAPVSRGEGPSLCQRYQAALATMAALSVHMARLGRNPRIPSVAQTSRKRSRSRELAATPPPRHRPLAPTALAAA